MGFFGFGKPKLKHRDPEVRLQALAGLGDGSQGTFAELASSDLDPRVRATAVGRITEVPRLVTLQKSEDPAVRRIATERLSGVAEQWMRVKTLDECRPFLEHLTDQKSLAELSVQAKDGGVRAAAFAKLTAQAEPSPALLALVAIQDAVGDVGLQAIARIDKRAVLKDVARKAKAERVRAAAATRIDVLGQEDDKPTPEQLRQARRKALPPLLDQGLRLAVSTEWERSAATWESLVTAWAAARDTLPLDADTITLDARFTRARTDFIARRATEEQRLAAVAQAREVFLTELAGRAALNPQEAGSHRFETISRWASLGDLPADVLMPMNHRLEAELARLGASSSVVENLAMETSSSGNYVPVVVTLSAEEEAKLEALSLAAEQLIDGGREAKFRFQELHKTWSFLAGDLPIRDPRRARFTDAYAAWKTRGKDQRERRDEQTVERLAAMRDVCVDAERLALAAEAFVGVPEQALVEPHAHELKTLQARWKAIGPVHFDKSQDLRERFRSALDRAYAPVNATREATDWERFGNLTKAEETITQVLALAESTDLAHVAAAVKQAHHTWKSHGPLPREKGQEAWLRFKAACDAQFERCRPYFAELDAQRLTNLERKRALLAEFIAQSTSDSIGLAGSPADVVARKSAHERIKAIQAEWKDIGPVPREHDADLWQAWRTACDGYFSKQREHFAVRNAEQVENLTQKLGLIVAAQDLAGAAEAGTRSAPELMKEAKRLQQIWKEVGHVPKDQADGVWDKWRTACDRVYATLKPHLAELDAQRQANLVAKESLIGEIEALSQQENPQWFKDDVRDMMLKWRSIGHVPRERMDELADRFRAACDKILVQ